jgi:hypothetical protein
MISDTIRHHFLSVGAYMIQEISKILQKVILVEFIRHLNLII